MIPEIKIKRALNLNETLQVLSEGEIKPLAGGTDLIVNLRKKKEVSFSLLDISSIDELKEIKEKDGKIFIGALTTYTDIVESDLLKEKAPLLNLCASKAAGVQIRNRATVGGNICNASPAADSVPALVAMGGIVHLKSSSGGRNIPLDKFVTGPYRTSIKEGELLTGVTVRQMSKEESCAFYKLGRREALAISRMNIAVILSGSKSEIKEAVISPGSVMPAPGRVREAEEIINGKKPSSELFEKAAGKVSDIMVKRSGVRWSTEYKKPVIKTLVKRALTESAVGLK